MKLATTTMLSVTILGLLGASAIAGATVIKDVPIAGFLAPNECTQEPLSLSGTAHLVFTNNGAHIKVTDVSATGVNTGTEWSSSSASVQNTTTNTNANGTVTTTFVFHIRLQSADERFQARITGHATTNANGDVTTDFTFETVDCQ